MQILHSVRTPLFVLLLAGSAMAETTTVQAVPLAGSTVGLSDAATVDDWSSMLWQAAIDDGCCNGALTNYFSSRRTIVRLDDGCPQRAELAHHRLLLDGARHNYQQTWA